MAENTNTERADFEAWYIAKIRESLPSAGDGWIDDQIRDSFMGFSQDRGYRSSSAQQAWGAWQARASLSLPAAGQEPVAWQERQQTSTGWTPWYDAKLPTSMGKGPGLSEVLGGIEYQWRPLYAAPQPAAQYSIDADPQGIRATVADAITGALAFGAQGVNKPPEGHWLAPFWNAAMADKIAPQPAVAAGWGKLPGQLPEPGKPVLLDIGKKYPIRAMWAAKHTVQAADDDTEWGEYDEATDTYYCPEGWYEWNEHEDTNWAVSATPRAWAPLPPTSSADSRKGD